ncbi:MAG: hypothetical protein ACTSRZ_13070 [Promethearchaeota archaeon]
MSYETMPPNARQVIFAYIFIAIFSVIMTITMLKRYKARKTQPTKLMSFVFLFLTLVIIVLLIGFIEMVITGEKRELYKFSLAFGYFLIMSANLFLIKFAQEIFSMGEKETKIYSIVAIILAILLVLPFNAYGVPEDEVEIPWFRTMTSLLMIIYSFVLYSNIAIKAFRVSKLSNETIAKAGFKWIGFSQIAMILFFAFMFLDTIYFTITGSAGYSFFVYLAWISAGFFLIACYLGLIMPDWFKKIYIDKETKKFK